MAENYVLLPSVFSLEIAVKDSPEIVDGKKDVGEGVTAPLVDMAVPGDGKSGLDQMRLVSQEQMTPKMSEAWWQQEHEELSKKASSTDSQLQFYGDSITNYINNGNRDTFQKNFAGLKPENFGIPGDISSELLYRVNHGELAGQPKLRVLMIGTNDLTADPPRTAQEIAKTIGDIVKTMKLQDPAGKILIMGILPRDVHGDPQRDSRQAKREEVNHIVSGLDNGNTIRFLDIGSHFVEANGDARSDLLPDHVHPSHQGYQVWSDSIKPLVDEMTK